MYKGLKDFQDRGTEIENKLDALHPNLRCVIDDLKLIEDVSTNLKYCKDEYLPQEVDESQGEWENRLNRISFRNFLGPLINGYAGLLNFAIDNTIPEFDPDNVDLKGTDIHKFFGRAIKRALKDRFCGILVEAPPNDPSIRTNRDLLAANRRPWLNLILRTNIINWREGIIDNEHVFEMVMLREQRWVADGEYGGKRLDLFRKLTVQAVEGGLSWVQYEVLQKDKDGKEIPYLDANGQPEAGRYSNLQRIPLVIMDAGLDQADDDDTVLAGRPPFIEFAEANIEHFQLRSEQRESIHRTGQVMLARGWPNNPPDDVPPVKMGSRFTIEYPAGGDVKYLEVKGEGIEAQEKAIAKLEGNLESAAVSVLTGSAPMETVVAALLRSAQGTANIKLMSGALTSTIQAVLVFFAAFYGKTSEAEVKVNDKVLTPPADTEHAKFIRDLHVVDQLIDEELMFKTLKQVKALPEEFDLNEVQPSSEESRADRPLRL
jgi:hypothetical protein